jgi:hypothetical protein
LKGFERNVSFDRVLKAAEAVRGRDTQREEDAYI